MSVGVVVLATLGLAVGWIVYVVICDGVMGRMRGTGILFGC